MLYCTIDLKRSQKIKGFALIQAVVLQFELIAKIVFGLCKKNFDKIF